MPRMKKTDEDAQIHDGEQWFALSLQEVTYSFGVSADVILDILNEGIIAAVKDEEKQFIFDHEAIRRIRTVLHLQEDLGINLAGAALALDLLQEIENLKRLIRI